MSASALDDNGCCPHVVAALVVYNWMINLGDEVDLFWSAPTKGASLLYFAIRYLAFVEPIIAMCTFYPMADKVGSDHDPRY